MRRGRPETIHAQKNGLPFFLFLIPFLVVPFVAATAATAEYRLVRIGRFFCL